MCTLVSQLKFSEFLKAVKCTDSMHYLACAVHSFCRFPRIFSAEVLI